MQKKVYVTMTDKFLSGWGKAEGKINKLIIICDDYTQAQTIKHNAQKRREMKFINICVNKPNYNKKRFLESWKTYDELGEIWKQ